MPTPVTFSEWLALIESRHPAGSDGIELGLDRVADVAARLAIDLPPTVFLVGGTNGKGSVCAMIDAILRSAGYRVGRYSSPHLLRYNERVRINDRPVDDNELIAAFADVERARNTTPLTYFEFGTLAAAVVFSRQALDAVVLEVGLGGRLDATNVFAPSCTVLTMIALDHQQFLGNTREAIGYEKAGIFRPGVPAICGDACPPHSVLAQAQAVGTPLRVLGRDFGYQRFDRQWSYWCGDTRRGGLALPALGGDYQIANAACAMAAVDSQSAKLPVAMRDYRQGLLNVELAGRFQVLPGKPTIVLDVAHNPQAAGALAQNLGNMAFHRTTWAVFGMMGDKDIDGVIAALGNKVDRWAICSLPGARAAPVQLLREHLIAHGQTVESDHASIASALQDVLGRADEADRILIFGSFLAVAGALQHLKRPA